MARTYKKNFNNVYKIPLYSRFFFWQSIIIILALIFSLVSYLISFNTLKAIMIILWLLVCILFMIRFYILIKSVIKAKSIRKYLNQTRAEKEVTQSLLSTLSVNRSYDTPYIIVPCVQVCDSTPAYISVEIEKLPGMYEIDKMIEDINASFTGKLSNYAVTSSIITTDGLKYQFILEDVASDKTFRPEDFNDIKAEKYILKLQENLTINLSERPHVAVWGKTGSKKTTVLFGMILQFFTMGADIRFIDGKDEFSAFKEFYDNEKIVSDIDDVISQLDDILKIVKERQELMSKEVRKRKKLGLKASEVGLRPVVVIADEIGSIVAQLDSKQTKLFINKLVAIIQKGRSVGVSVIASTQDPSTDTLPQKIRQQFSTKILLGSANSEIQRMSFGEVATKADVEDFRGYYSCDGLTTQPQKFFVCDLHTNNFNKLEVFKKAYEIGFSSFLFLFLQALKYSFLSSIIL